MTTTVDLKETLRLHTLWLAGDSKGVEAYLSGADLREADLGNGIQWAVVGPQGSRGDSIVYIYSPDRDEAHAGCFTGTLAELTAAVMAKHGGTSHEAPYLRAIAYLESLRKGE